MGFASLLASADRAVLNHLGDSVSYMPRSGTYAGVVQSVTGVFSNAYLLADIGEAGVSTTTPAVFLRLSDLPGASDEGRDFDEDSPVITRSGIEYVVREAKRDGEGGVLFLLRVSE